MPKTPLQLVILAGGSSSRLWPLREKSLIRFMDKPLLAIQLERYLDLGFKDIAVVCSPHNLAAIQAVLAEYAGRANFTTTIQQDARGMGDALLTLEPLLQNTSAPLPVYICQVHDIFDPGFHQSMLAARQENPQASLLAAYRVKNYFPGGYLTLDGSGRITGIVEKPGRGSEPSDLVNIVAHIHPDLRILLEGIRQEYASPVQSDDHYERAMGRLMTRGIFKAVPYSGGWYPIKYPWHVLDAMHHFLDGIQEHRGEGTKIEEGVRISGPVHIGSNVRIFSGADIRGPVYIGDNCVIGQFSSIRHSMISRDCIAGLTAEVNRSYLGVGAWMHDSKALDSVLADSDEGKHINLSAGVITANFRTDGGAVMSTVKGQRLDTGRNKFGAAIGSGAFIGINSSLAPGVKIGEDAVVGMGTNLPCDVPDGARYYFDQEEGRVVKKGF